MRKILISAAALLSIAGLAACSDSGVDENATGSVNKPTEQTAPADPAAPVQTAPSTPDTMSTPDAGNAAGGSTAPAN